MHLWLHRNGAVDSKEIRGKTVLPLESGVGGCFLYSAGDPPPSLGTYHLSSLDMGNISFCGLVMISPPPLTSSGCTHIPHFHWGVPLPILTILNFLPTYRKHHRALKCQKPHFLALPPADPMNFELFRHSRSCISQIPWWHGIYHGIYNLPCSLNGSLEVLLISLRWGQGSFPPPLLRWRGGGM